MPVRRHTLIDISETQKEIQVEGVWSHSKFNIIDAFIYGIDYIGKNNGIINKKRGRTTLFFFYLDL
jgi:hypothetical protein